MTYSKEQLEKIFDINWYYNGLSFINVLNDESGSPSAVSNIIVAYLTYENFFMQYCKTYGSRKVSESEVALIIKNHKKFRNFK